MSNADFGVVDRNGIPTPILVQVNGDGSVSPYHVEDTAQRAALVAAIGALASDSHAAAILSALQGPLSVTGPLTAAQLTTAALATHSDAQAILTALAAVGLAAGENHIGAVGGSSVVVSQSFTRPANTTAYASGQLVANSATAASVVPMSFTIGRTASGPGAGGMIRRARLRSTGKNLTNAQFRVHIYGASPTCSNGDGGAWLTDNGVTYRGKIDIALDELFTDVANGTGTPNTGSEINFAGQMAYCLLEARAGYAPASGEVFTLELEVLQN